MLPGHAPVAVLLTVLRFAALPAETCRQVSQKSYSAGYGAGRDPQPFLAMLTLIYKGFLGKAAFHDAKAI